LIVGGRSGSLQDAFGMKNGSWSVGLTLSIPVGTVLSRALQAQAKVDLDRTNLELKFLLQQAETKVRIALRDVETAAKRIEALGVARALAEKQLAAEETKLRSGYSTNYFVLLYQGEVAKQRSEEIRAGIDLTLAVSRLNREMGISLRERNIKIGGNPVD
jgi:outer membrane protein TolC